MARIEWVEQRLQNWARWKLSAGSMGELGYSGVNLADSDGGRSGYITATVPILNVEASDTDAAVNALPNSDMRMAVREFYTGRGGVRDKARRLRIGESTLYLRVDQAHRIVGDFIMDLQAKRRQERDRVETLQVLAARRIDGAV